MKKQLKHAFALISLAAVGGFPVASQAYQATAPQSSNMSQSSNAGQSSNSSMSSKKTAARPAKTGAATPEQIADAKSKGMVWVNLNTKVYHKDDKFYGTTKNGQFMTEADAQKAGAHLAGAGGAKAKAAPAK